MTFRSVVAAASLSIAPALSAQQPVVMPPPVPQIVVSGEGEVKVTPDRASIFVAIETRAATAAKAGSDNATRARAVIEAIRKLRIPPDKITTEGYAVHPEWRYEERSQKLVGYVARNTVRVELENIEQTGPVIDAALAAGANNIHAMSFWSSKQDEARRAALTNAVAKARGDAEALARAAGGSLGTMLELTSQQHGYPRPMMDMAQMRTMSTEAAAAPTPINPGEQTVTANVFIRWQFVPASR